MKHKQRQSLKDAVSIVGTQSSLANAVGISQQMISKLLNNPDLPISPKTAVAIELATDGKVSRKRFKPDEWEYIWPELKEDEHLSSTSGEEK
ncbi:helix-turn-helix domain-containing protein [Vibrio harveyi]|uniref:transcriptional regulator n=1 Tax=Vibrio harveyi TaxID=669 RepID=UPI000C7CB62A|nr:YdaS family helix-turn-helix protein [Vibrio harveyi]AWB00223.1 helix-turn-helix domain-containing protein [Vibrio harveyi]